MSKDEHLNFLAYLEAAVSFGWDVPHRAIPKPEGAFWFGDLSLPEYASKYREECIKEGWIDE